MSRVHLRLSAHGPAGFCHDPNPYVPDQLCVELKSLKLYLWSYRNEGAFHEAVINKILDDLVQACQPRKMTVVGDFNIRGGIHTTITASYAQS